MSWHIFLIIVGQSFINVLWLCSFLASHPKPVKRNRLKAPSISCERTGDWKVHAPVLGARQAE